LAEGRRTEAGTINEAQTTRDEARARTKAGAKEYNIGGKGKLGFFCN
jgi:hypothetical protein